MTDREFCTLRAVFLSGLGPGPYGRITNDSLVDSPMLTPGEMVLSRNPGNIESFVAAELTKSFTQENGFNEW